MQVNLIRILKIDIDTSHKSASKQREYNRIFHIKNNNLTINLQLAYELLDHDVRHDNSLVFFGLVAESLGHNMSG